MLYDVLMKIRYHRKQIALVHHISSNIFTNWKALLHTLQQENAVFDNDLTQIVGLMDDDRT